MAAAEEKEAEAGAKKTGPLDPIVDRSLAPHFFVASGLLALTVAWSVYDEVWARRPYKRYQETFQELAVAKGEHELKLAEAELERQTQSADYQAAAEEMRKAEEALAAWDADEGRRLRAEFDKVTADLNDIRLEFQVARGDYQPLVYDYDHARLEGHEGAAKELIARIKDAEPRIKKVFGDMTALSDRRKAIQATFTEKQEPVQRARARLAEKVPAQGRVDEAKMRIGGAHALETGVLKPYQIYIPALGAVDRCIACHIATDKPGYAEADWDAAKEAVGEDVEMAKAAFTTHPHFLSTDPKKFDWISRHNIGAFGCTSCHWGNGPATTSPEKAHGLEDEAKKSWTHPMEFQLTPLLPLGSLAAVREGGEHFGNLMEAACAKCHVSETALEGGPQLSYGRQLIEDVGCWGCHKIAGFEVKEQELGAIQDRLAKELRPEKARLRRLVEGGAGYDERTGLADVAHQIEVAERRLRELEMEIKFIGPDLNRKERGGALKDKIYYAWLPRWIRSPQHFRPGTWMPNPLLADEEVLDVAAYVWQQASGEPAASFEPAAPKDPKIAAEGRALVEERGCLACHTLEDRGTAPEIEALRATTETTPEGERVTMMGEKVALYDIEKWWRDPKTPLDSGGRPELLKKGVVFGPSLARVGEKIRYEWLLAWVMDPKAIQPHTRMPSLRLTKDEAEKIAAFLTTLRSEPPGGEKFANLPIGELERIDRAQRGLDLVVRAGCFNCHAMDLKDPAKGWAPIPNPGKIGAELSSHGSKPLAQFDFGFVELPHMRNAWLQTKVMEPRIFDRGKYKGDPNDRLRMPRFGLTAAEGAAITTVLAGLTDQQVAAQYIHDPGPGTREGAIIEGERLVRKFNCRSCHVIRGEGQWARDELLASVMRAKKIDDELEAEPYLPPTLNGQGRRTNPDWLFTFLKNPGAHQPLRPWHVLRMPTFDMSDAEAIALVQYFTALEKERFPYDGKEEAAPPQALLDEGRALFAGEATCWQCHQIGAYQPPKPAIDQGPNFALARDRLRGEWMNQFIPDPFAFIGRTKMTSFFGSKPFAAQPPEKQREIEALTAYIRRLSDPGFRKAENWVEGGKGPAAPPK